jgi:hypothetical protein
MAHGIQGWPAGDGGELRSAVWGGRRVVALRVCDESMSEEGIHGGDYLLVEPRARVEAGRTVLAEVEGALTVKRLQRTTDGRVRLQPASPQLLPLVLPVGRVRVVGAVVGVLRRQGFGRARRRASTPRPSPAEAATIEPRLVAMGQALRAAEARAAESAGDHHDRRLRELARNLRALRDCYLETSTPRLREALLREAAEVVRRLGRFGVEPALTSA